MSSLSSIFNIIYKRYKNQNWPIISSLDHSPPLLNIAFPDSSVTYYASFFNSNDTVTISGTIPQDIYFWSLCMYNSTGQPIQSWNYTDFLDDKYNIIIGKGNVIPPDGYYCIINRIYNQQNSLDEKYLPSIDIKGSKLISVTMDQREQKSNYVQDLMWPLFKKDYGGKTPSQLIPNISNYQTFFLPSEESLSSVFPNPSAKYLIVFPSTNNVIKVTGTLYPSIGYGNSQPINYISYMASNLEKTSTDTSIDFTQLDQEYTLYVAFSKIEAIKFGYNEKNDKLLLWSKNDQYPLLVYREVSALGNTPLFNQLDNSNVSINGSDVKNIMGIYYPNAECF